MTTNKTRLNTDLRKKIGGLILSHFENEKTTELENFKSAKEDIRKRTMPRSIATPASPETMKAIGIDSKVAAAMCCGMSCCIT